MIRISMSASAQRRAHSMLKTLLNKLTDDGTFGRKNVLPIQYMVIISYNRFTTGGQNYLNDHYHTQTFITDKFLILLFYSYLQLGIVQNSAIRSCFIVFV